MAPSYFKRIVGTVAAGALALMLYAARPAKAQDTAKSKPDSEIELIVRSFEKAYRDSKGKGIDEQIENLLLNAVYDTSISNNQRTYLVTRLAGHIQDKDRSVRVTALLKKYHEMLKKQTSIQKKYLDEVTSANAKRGEDRTIGIARAEVEYARAILEMEKEIPGAQYAREALEYLQTAKTRAAGPMKWKPFRDDCEEMMAAAQAVLNDEAKAKRPFRELRGVRTAVEVALEEAEAAEKPETKAERYREAIGVLQNAEELFPFDQYTAEISGLQAKLKAAQEAAKKPPTRPGKKPPGAGTRPPRRTGKKPPGAGTRPPRRTGKKPPGAGTRPPRRDLGDKGGITEPGFSFSDFLTSKNKYDAFVEAMCGFTTEDRNGNIETIRGMIGEYAALDILRQYESWTNISGNEQNRHTISSMLDFKPLALLPALSWTGLTTSEESAQAVSIGGLFELSKEKEWEYLSEILTGTNPEVTANSDIRHITEDEFFSAWADVSPGAIYLRLTGFMHATDTETREHKVETIENIDPAGNYPKDTRTRFLDREWTRGGTLTAGLDLGSLVDAIKGNFSFYGAMIYHDERFADAKRTRTKHHSVGLQGEIYDRNETFGAAMNILQDIGENPDTGRDSLTTSHMQATAGLNISPLEIGDLNINLAAVAEGWISTFEGEHEYGGGGALIVGKNVGSLPSVIQLLSQKNAHRIGARPEISDTMQDFLEKSGFRDLPRTGIASDNEWGITFWAYYNNSKELGLNGRPQTTQFVNLGGALNTPPLDIMLSAFYREGILEREFGVDATLFIKKYGIAAGAGFSQRELFVTNEMTKTLMTYLMIPFGSTSKKKEDKK